MSKIGTILFFQKTLAILARMKTGIDHSGVVLRLFSAQAEMKISSQTKDIEIWHGICSSGADIVMFISHAQEYLRVIYKTKESQIQRDAYFKDLFGLTTKSGH